MGEKITPATKKVARADGVKQGTANKTLTTPSQADAMTGKHFGIGKGSGDSLFK